MKTAMHRTGTGGSNFTGGSGVNLDDSSLVAYWAFDEGQGYVIKDVTGHGHDLHATSIPHWQVCLPDVYLLPFSCLFTVPSTNKCKKV